MGGVGGEGMGRERKKGEGRKKGDGGNGMWIRRLVYTFWVII